MYRIKKLFLFESPSYVDWGIYFTAFIILQVPAIINFYYNDGNNNSYIHFAQSLLNGDLSLPTSIQNVGDLAYLDGKYYLPYPPLPSIILVPFVAIFGADHINTVAIATVMACICLYLAYNIFLKLKVIKEYIPWLIAAMVFGTGFWFALFTTHHVYAFAHVTSFLFQLLLINEILGRRRWWLVGIFIGCTFLTRQFTIFYLFFAAGYMLYLHKQDKDRISVKDIAALLVPVSFFVCLYLVYNYVRFGSPFDSGYSHIVFIGVLKERVEQYGVFSYHYFLFNLYATLIKGFSINFQGSTYLNIRDMDLWGTSILSASPFLIAGIKANWPKLLKASAWITILAIYIGQLFYHNNGFEQVNTSRFSLDFLPLLFVLLSLGVAKLPMWLMKGMIGYAIILNVISFVIHLIYQ
jgi:4-amino-4-deoxy-L-arabinose transferase-like glycosyltransferase